MTRVETTCGQKYSIDVSKLEKNATLQIKIVKKINSNSPQLQILSAVEGREAREQKGLG